MKSNSIFDSEYFPIETINGIAIITVKVPRATSKESEEFKQIIQSIVLTNHNKIIIDFSNCQYADSMIIGIMVETVKTVRKKNGDIYVITPASSIKIMFARTGLFKIFKQFWTKEEAIESFSLL
jgi:anti-anti-sigma factor